MPSDADEVTAGKLMEINSEIACLSYVAIDRLLRETNDFPFIKTYCSLNYLAARQEWPTARTH